MFSLVFLTAIQNKLDFIVQYSESIDKLRVTMVKKKQSPFRLCPDAPPFQSAEEAPVDSSSNKGEGFERKGQGKQRLLSHRSQQEADSHIDKALSDPIHLAC